MNKSPLLATMNSILMTLSVLTLVAFVLLCLGWRPLLNIALRTRSYLQKCLLLSPYKSTSVANDFIYD
jgi:hypothetical protein